MHADEMLVRLFSNRARARRSCPTDTFCTAAARAASSFSWQDKQVLDNLSSQLRGFVQDDSDFDDGLDELDGGKALVDSAVLVC